MVPGCGSRIDYLQKITVRFQGWQEAGGFCQESGAQLNCLPEVRVWQRWTPTCSAHSSRPRLHDQKSRKRTFPRAVHSGIIDPVNANVHMLRAAGFPADVAFEISR